MPEERHIKVLFSGLGNARVAWYRVVLPAMYNACDWAGFVGQPPYLRFVTGYVQGKTQTPTFPDYDLVVLQQPRGKGWLRVIQELKAGGTVVLAEYDDYVHGIRKSNDHDFRQFFRKEDLAQMETCLRECDGLIASTDYIARRYSSFVPRTWVCENGLDMGRYRLTSPPRGDVDGVPSVTIMWAGATGHSRGIEDWLAVVDRMMSKYPHVCFASIGQQFASRFTDKFQNRVISVPFAALETYPAAMMLGDIALAPAGDSSWYRGKSDLRAMEAAALGLPLIADRHYRHAVQHGQTGYVVDNAGQAISHLETLIEDEPLRRAMGENGRDLAQEEFDMTTRRGQWKTAILEALDPKGECVRAA